jgi:hypothetical protein
VVLADLNDPTVVTPPQLMLMRYCVPHDAVPDNDNRRVIATAARIEKNSIFRTKKTS